MTQTDEKRGERQAHNSASSLGEVILLCLGALCIGGAIAVWVASEPLFVDEVIGGSEELVRIGFGGAIFGGIFLLRTLLPVTPVQPVRPQRTSSSTAENATEHVIQPGADIDRQLQTLQTEYTTNSSHHKQLTAQLRELAVQTIAYYEDIETSEAAHRLRTGTWTENQRAASLFLPPERRAYRTRVRLWLSPQETYQAQVEAAIAELNAVTQS